MPPDETELRALCLAILADMPEVTVAPIDIEMSFAQLGLDSASSISFLIAIEERLDIELDADVVAQFPTVAALCTHILGLVANRTAP